MDTPTAESIISDFEQIASRTIAHDGSLAGYYISADDWRRIRASLRLSSARVDTPEFVVTHG